MIGVDIGGRELSSLSSLSSSAVSVADAIAFVVKFSSTPQQEVKAAMAALDKAKRDGVPILTVLNQQTSNPAAYRGKYAGYYAEA